MTHPLHPRNDARARSSQLSEFAEFVRRKTGLPVGDYAALHTLSTRDVGLFWALFLEWSGVIAGGEPHPPRTGEGMVATRFFPGLRLSWPENLLADRGPDEDRAIAVVSLDESGMRSELSRGDLRRRVQSVAAGLAGLGMGEGDRVAALARNTVDTLVACLAVASLGATWSSLSLDMGRDAIRARLKALEPRLLLAHGSTRYGGATTSPDLPGLVDSLGSLEGVVLLDESTPLEDLRAAFGPRFCTGLRDVDAAGIGRLRAAPERAWRRFPFDHPLFVLFSSGTTGEPKAIVHGHGGTLLEHVKEHRLHCDLKPEDRLCFQTSTGWMMWNWTVSALASGARVVLYDGSVSYPDRDSFLQVAAREGVTVLGLSPAYLRYLGDAGVADARGMLRRVRTVLSTGSVLPIQLHRWAKEHLAEAPVESISGGTDILGCFVMGSPWCDTYEGESSCVGLGLDVQAWTDRGPLREGTGELVCMQPFPSRPVAFLHDRDGKRLHEAYYAQHAGAWTHGDLVELTPRGTVRVLGRCDGVLNIRGIRIGPSEIYDVIHRTVPEVQQAMAVDADDADEPGGKRLILFVVPRGGVTVDRPLVLRIKKELRERASAAHVPALVVPVDELPTTFNNKASETALQDALNGRPVRNLAALRNPDSVAAAVAAFRRAP